LTARTNIDAIGRGGEDPRPGNSVLRVDGIRDLLRRQTELRQLNIRYLYIDALFLVGDKIDLVDVRNSQQLGSLRRSA